MKTNIKIINGNRIGGCITVISSETTKIIIDFGEALPGSDKSDDIPFDWEKEKPDAIFFTHYHGDHIGRFAEIPLSVPVYMGEVSYKVMKNVYSRTRRTELVKALEERKALHFIEVNKTISVGDIEITPYSVDHSAFDAYMFLISANGENIVHTGDYRDHGHRGHTMKNGRDRNVMLDVIKYYITKNGKQRINALITEGTMLTRYSDKTYSEKQMLSDAVKFFNENRYVFLKVSSTNVDSLASFAKAAKVNGINLYVNQYQLEQIEIYRETGKRHGTDMYGFENVYPLFPAPEDCRSEKQMAFSEKQRKIMRQKGFVIVSDGAWEKYYSEFSDMPCKAIYSMWNGYIEQTNKAFNKNLYDFSSKTNAVSMHTSGHAYPGFICEVIKAVNPSEVIIPIHTEAAEELFNLDIGCELKSRIIRPDSVSINARDEIHKKLRVSFGNNRISLPRDIVVSYADPVTYKFTLCAESVQTGNMQKDENAFEGWICAVYAAFDGKRRILLDVDKLFEYSQYEKNGHLCRFLYRIMKFREQYGWFSLSDYLQAQADDFKEYISNGVFLNNIPTGSANENEKPECKTEAKLAVKDALRQALENQFDVGDGTVYRQLPVGLFKDKVSASTLIFTGSKSAADLWNISGDEFRVYELKTCNRMVGIVTETFFYSNYFLDLLTEKGMFTLNRESAGDRGYSQLLNTNIKKVTGVFLADDYHPLVNDMLMNCLNQNGTNINYILTTYS